MVLTIVDQAGNALAVPTGNLSVTIVSDPPGAWACQPNSHIGKLPVVQKGSQLHIKPFRLVMQQSGEALPVTLGHGPSAVPLHLACCQASNDTHCHLFWLQAVLGYRLSGHALGMCHVLGIQHAACLIDTGLTQVLQCGDQRGLEPL